MEETGITIVEPPKDIWFPVGEDPGGNRFAIWPDMY